MGDGFVPEGLGTLQPWWRNLVDNRTTVQFDHRVAAETLFVLVAGYYLWARCLVVPARLQWALNGLAAAVAIQAVLGISTLVLVVPVALAVAHQGGALVVFGCALWVAREVSPANG
jgi:cytochrome c oxidase assembly protein subunit 15